MALVATAQFMANDFSLTVKTALATVLFMMFGLCYSLMNCAYGAMVPAITKNPNERAQLAAWRQGGATVGLLLCTVGFMPIQALFISQPSLAIWWPRWCSSPGAVLHVVVLQRGERTLRGAHTRSP